MTGPDDFQTFWAHYPRHQAKLDARKAWAQTASVRPALDVILAAIAAQCQSEQWRKNNGAFIPYAATWLRGERWDDEMEVSLPAALPAARAPTRYDVEGQEAEARRLAGIASAEADRDKVAARFAQLKLRAVK